MTQNITQNVHDFLRDCTTITADGSLTTLDELEGLYAYWCSLRDEEASDGCLVPELVELDGVESLTHDGVECVEGVVLSGPVMADFILTCDFAGSWGHPDELDLGVLAQVASAS